MTLAEMRTYFRMLVDDRDASSWPPTEVDNVLNRAQERVQMKINDADEGYFSACQSYSVEADADSFEFSLPSDHQKVVAGERLVPGSEPVPARWVPFARRHAATAVVDDRPILYLRGGKIGVVAPSQSYTLRMWYVKRLADLVNDADVSEIPIEFHQLVCLEAARICCLADGKDFTKWEDAYNEQQAMLSLFIEDRQRQEPRSVHYVSD